MPERYYTINISGGTIWKGIVIAALVWAVFILKDLVLVLLISVVIASAVEPAAQWFIRYRIPRVISVLSVYLAIIISIAGIFYLFVPIIIDEASRFTEIISVRISDIPLVSPDSILASSGSGGIVSGISEILPIGETLKTVEQFAGIPAGAFHAVSAVFGGVFSLVLIVIISFYLSVQDRGIENFLRIVVPLRHEEYIIGLWKRSQSKIGKWMQGQLLLGVLIGLLVYLGLTILGVKYALLLGLFAMVAELIPIFGPVIAAVPAVLIGFTDGVPLGLMVVGLYVIIQQFENHLIYPLVMRKVIGVPPLLVIISLLIGAQLAGFFGIILAVPVTAAILEFADDVQKKKRKERGVSAQ